jgi:hypothetical protein
LKAGLSGRFVIQDYAAARPFASFLPGIAGPLGIPLWAFYVNRGQAITSFGVESKDKPIMEFQPANRAYRTTPYTGFRTFVKIQGQVYEPFAPWQRAAPTRMCIGMNELELQETNPARGLQTNVLYFVLPGENLAGLVRRHERLAGAFWLVHAGDLRVAATPDVLAPGHRGKGRPHG